MLTFDVYCERTISCGYILICYCYCRMQKKKVTNGEYDILDMGTSMSSAKIADALRCTQEERRNEPYLNAEGV